MNMSHTWKHDVDGPSWLPVERILWAPTNSAHESHLHVVGLPRMSQDELPTSFQVTDPIEIIMKALDDEFGTGDHYMVDDPDLGWTHMGIYNDRFIGGTTTWSQHAGGNAIDIGPYYGEEEQQKFYDFLTLKEDEMVSRSDKADEGNDALAANFNELVDRGVMSKYTQPGGVTFNDELATFLLRFEDDVLELIHAIVDEKIAQDSNVDSHARSLAKKALDKLTAIKNSI